MYNIVDDEFDWTRGSGGTPSKFTGPTTDHTTNSAKGTSTIIFFALLGIRKVFK